MKDALIKQKEVLKSDTFPIFYLFSEWSCLCRDLNLPSVPRCFTSLIALDAGLGQRVGGHVADAVLIGRLRI